MSGLMEVFDAGHETLGGANHRQAARGREAHRPGTDDSHGREEGGDYRPDLLSMANSIRGVEGGRGQTAAVARAGELAIEADRGRAGARHLDAAGSATGEILSPARRRDAVVYLVKRHKVS